MKDDITEIGAEPAAPVDFAAAYPGAAEAVRWAEQVPSELWGRARRCNIPPRMLVEELAKGPPGDASDVKDGMDVALVLAQMRHPDFELYLRAKLGLV